MTNKKNFIITGLVIIILGLIYLNRITNNKIATKDNALIAANDTVHLFKTKLGNQGAYISTIVADKNDLISILNLKDKTGEQYKDIIDSLKKNKSLQSAVIVNTNTETKYIHSIDTVYKRLTLNDTISTKWYDAGIHIKDSQLTLNLNQRDELNLISSLKDNKGWFTGSTLTTYAVSKNPDTKVTGITSISTVVNKRKARLGIFLGPGLTINNKGNISVGLTAGFGITF